MPVILALKKALLAESQRADRIIRLAHSTRLILDAVEPLDTMGFGKFTVRFGVVLCCMLDFLDLAKRCVRVAGRCSGLLGGAIGVVALFLRLGTTCTTPVSLSGKFPATDSTLVQLVPRFYTPPTRPGSPGARLRGPMSGRRSSTR